MNAETPILVPHEFVATLRRDLGESLEVFGARIGVSKGVMSELERGLRQFTPDQALAIEALSAGRIDAAALNELVRRAREQVAGHGAACATSPDARSPGKADEVSPLARAASGAGGDAGPADACPPLAGPAEPAR